ncbi:hypothetical protein HDE_05961 [Halotydeus destructor]|nr:hypothetical protein HDE_05961 [Halotydeus destructor]
MTQDKQWSAVLLIVVTISSLSLPSSAYYCDHDLCSSTEQYCCGDNACCHYPNSWWSWYIWISLLFLIGVSSLLWGCLRILCFEQFTEQGKVLDKLVKKVTEKNVQNRRWLEDPESSLLYHNSQANERPEHTNKDIDDIM